MKNIHVKVDSLKFLIWDSKHDFTRCSNRYLQRHIRKAIRCAMEYIDGQLVTFVIAKVSEDEMRADALKVYVVSFDTFLDFPWLFKRLREVGKSYEVL